MVLSDRLTDNGLRWPDVIDMRSLPYIGTEKIYIQIFENAMTEENVEWDSILYVKQGPAYKTIFLQFTSSE